MGLPKKSPSPVDVPFKIVDLPETVWKVQLLPSQIPLPSNVLYPGLEGGFKYEKIFEFIRQYLDESNDYDKIVYFEKALQVHEYGTKGVKLHRDEKYDDAIECYDKAIELDPGSWICRYNKAYCHFQLKEIEESLKELHSAISTLASEPRNYALLGDILVHQEKYAEAFGAYHQFLRHARTKGSFVNVSFQLRYQLGLLETKDEKLTKLHPFPFDHRCICGKNWDFPGNCPSEKNLKAKEDKKHAFKDVRYPRISDWHLQGKLECTTCHHEIETWTCKDCGREYDWGMGTLKSYHPVEGAISVQSTYFDYGGEDTKAKTYVESVLQETAFSLLEFRYQDALNILYKSSHLIYEDPIYHYKFVEVLRLMGREVEGVKHYENILQSFPNSVYAQYGLALLAPNAATGSKIFQEIIQENPKFAPAYNAIGDLLFEDGRSEEALEYYHRSMDIDPDWIPVYRSLAILYQGVGEDHMSIHYRNVLHRKSPYFDDRHENAYIAFAGRLQNQKEYGRANQVLTSISEIAKAAVSNEEQRVHFELGFEPWLKVKKISNLIQMGQNSIANKMLGQLTTVIENAGFTDDSGMSADLRLNLVKTLIDEGLNEEATEYLDSKDEKEAMDPVAVEWLKNYDSDRKKMHRVLCGDRTVDPKEVASYSIRSLAEIRGPKRGFAFFIDSEGLMIAPATCVGDQNEVEVLTYDGLWLQAKVLARSCRAPFVVLKAPPLSEGSYFYMDLNTVPVIRPDEPVIVIGSQNGDDFVGIEASIKQDFVDSTGVRYLIMDRVIEGASGGSLIVTKKGAVLGMSIQLDSCEEKLRYKLVLDADEILQLVNGVNVDYQFVYRKAFCGNCGRVVASADGQCNCGYKNPSEVRVVEDDDF